MYKKIIDKYALLNSYNLLDVIAYRKELRAYYNRHINKGIADFLMLLIIFSVILVFFVKNISLFSFSLMSASAFSTIYIPIKTVKQVLNLEDVYYKTNEILMNEHYLNNDASKELLNYLKYDAFKSLLSKVKASKRPKRKKNNIIYLDSYFQIPQKDLGLNNEEKLTQDNKMPSKKEGTFKFVDAGNADVKKEPLATFKLPSKIRKLVKKSHKR